MIRRRTLLFSLCSGALFFGAVVAQQASTPEETHIIHHAHGTFTVKMGAPSPGPAEGLSRFTMDKQIHGGFEGTGKGEMIAAGNYQLATAGYVAIELLTGKLDGKAGSFALQHTATMNGKALDMDVVITPGSGTGELKGIGGAFKILIKEGQHYWDLDYTLPESK